MINGGLPEFYKIVDASAGPVTSNGGVTCDYVSLKNVHKAWIIASFTQAAGHATVVSPKQATAVAGTSVKALTAAGAGWFNEDTATSDTLVVQTAATTYTVTNDIKKKIVICEVVPEQNMDINAGFDVLGCTISDSSQATNFVSVIYVLASRYPQANIPAAITN